jgi:hypothetical protein
MTTGEEPRDRSGMIAAALSSVVLLTFLGAAQWLIAHWDELTRPPAVTELVQPMRPVTPRGAPQIAVSSRERYDQYDDIGALLKEMGSGYAFDSIPLRQLGDLQRLKKYRVLFLGCAAEMAPASAPMPAMRKFEHVSVLTHPTYLENVRKALTEFVEGGGALYASDWAASYLELAFARQISFANNRSQAQKVEARVLDPGLKDIIGPRLELTFDTDLWVVPESAGMGTAHLEGEVVSPDGQRQIHPLLCSFKHGKGQVIFTSFHNEKQLSEKERDLLKYLVLKPITAQAAEAGQQVLRSQNFTVSKESLFSTGSGADRWIPYPAQDGELTFVVSWNDSGDKDATLKLQVKLPTGDVLEAQGDASPVKVTVPRGRAKGDLSYSVAAVHVPFANFPYVVTVGVKP